MTRFLKTFALFWVAGFAVVVATIVVLAGLHYMFQAGYQFETALVLLITVAAAGAAWEETRIGEE